MKLTRTVFAALALCVFVGCQEKVVDVETPIGDVEVTENTMTDDVKVDVAADAGAEE